MYNGGSNYVSFGSREHITTHIWCPMSILTTWPSYPVGRWRSQYDRVSRVPTYQTGPGTKLESARVDGDGTTR